MYEKRKLYQYGLFSQTARNTHITLTKLKKHVSIENFTNNHHLSLYMELV
jgi:hypothetical protein